MTHFLEHRLLSDEVHISENEFVSLSHVGDIIIGKYKANCIIDLKAAKIIEKQRDAAIRKMGVKKVYVIADVSEMKSISPEARKYFSSPEQNKQFIATAYVIKTLTAYVLSQFYIKLTPNKPMPEKAFRKMDEALNWVQNLRVNS